MKPIKIVVLLATLLGVAVSGEAIALDCSNGTRLSPTQISALLGGNTVCVPVATVDPMTWQELHTGNSTSTTGSLIDFKRGVGHATDPSENVGSWTVNGSGVGNASVTHNYGSGGTYTYEVHGSGVIGTTHSFCGISASIGAPVSVDARVKSGGGAC